MKYFMTGMLHVGGHDIELFDTHLDHVLVYLLFREYSNKLLSGIVQLLGLVFLEVIAMPLAECLVAFCKGLEVDLPDTVHMPESGRIIDPFLAYVITCWGVKEVIHARISHYPAEK